MYDNMINATVFLFLSTIIFLCGFLSQEVGSEEKISIPVKKIVIDGIIDEWQKHTDVNLEDLRLCFVHDLCKNEWTPWTGWSQCSAEECGKQGKFFCGGTF